VEVGAPALLRGRLPLMASPFSMRQYSDAGALNADSRPLLGATGPSESASPSLSPTCPPQLLVVGLGSQDKASSHMGTLLLSSPRWLGDEVAQVILDVRRGLCQERLAVHEA